MDAEIKRQWVAALRSGRYPQTTGYLRDENGFCCLGVLCDIRNSKVWIPAKAPSTIGAEHYTFDGQSHHLPMSVYLWAGLVNSSPDVDVPCLKCNGADENCETCNGDSPIEMTLGELNDGGRTLIQIADVIWEQL